MLKKKVIQVTYLSLPLGMNFIFLLDLTGSYFTHCLGGLDKLDQIQISVIEGACHSRMHNFKPYFLEGSEVVCCSSSKNDLVVCACCLISSSCGSGCLEVL